MLFPYQIKTSIDIERNVFTIKNKTEHDWIDLRISLTEGYGEEIFIELCEIKANQEKEFNFNNSCNFLNYDHGIDLRISNNYQIIYKYKLNPQRKKAFIIYSNKNFEPISEQLLVGLTRYTEHQIVYYTVDFDSELHLKFDNLKCKRLNYSVDEDLITDGQYMQMLKPQVFMNAIEDGYDDIVFLDTDVQVNPNIKNIFDYFKDVENDTPILQRQYWQYLFIGPNYIPGPLLKNEMGYHEEKQFQCHGITNIFLFKKEFKPFITKWCEWCQNTTIVNEIRKKEYLHDELIFNLLTWKEKVKFKLVNFLFNVTSLKDIKTFNCIEQDQTKNWFNFNDIGLGHLFQSYAPFHKDDIMGYHCIKDPVVASEINDYIFSEFKKNN